MSERTKSLINMLHLAKTDEDRLLIARAFRKDITVWCDNDSTHLTVKGDDEAYFCLDEYIGWSQGVFTLLKMLGINAKAV